MMQPYMGVYGITKKLLEQPCNLELQIYWETHGFLRLESKQWINAGFDYGEISKEVSYPIAFTQILGSGMTSTSKASISAAQPGNKSVVLSMDKINTGTVGIKMILLGR